MSLRDILAELDVRIRGAADVQAVNAGMDQFRAAGIRASAEAARLVGQLRLLSRAEGDNTQAINDTRVALDRATSAASAYRNAAARIADENRNAFGRFQGSVGSFGGGQGTDFFRNAFQRDSAGFGGGLGNFLRPPPPNSLLTPETLTSVRAGMTELAPAVAGVAAAMYGVDRGAHEAWAQIHAVITEGDEIGDSAARLGISARAYQELGYVAEQTGSSLEAAARAFPAIARNIQSSHGAQVYRELGVSVRDASGALRSQEDVFYDTAAALGRMEPGTRQAGLAQRALGRAGAELLPFIRTAPGEIDRLRGRFTELGGGLSNDVVENADEAQHALTDFDLATRGARATLANTFLPTIAEGISTFAGWIGKTRQAWDSSSAGIVTLALLRSGFSALAIPVGIVLTPIALFALGLVGIFLAVEDVTTAFRGGRSVLGGLAEDFLRAEGINRTFIGSLEAIGVAWDVLVANTTTSAASILGSVARLEDGLGVGSPTDAAHVAAGQAAAQAGQARAAAFASQAGLQRRESVRFADRAAAVDDNPNTRGVNVSIVNNGVTDPEAAGRASARHLTRALRDHTDTTPRARASHG